MLHFVLPKNVPAKFFSLCFILSACFTSQRLFAQLTQPADGGCNKAMVSERIGLTDIAISYSRPALKGREGKIWGNVVQEGFANGGFSDLAPWRAGANESTTIEFSTDISLEGHQIAAGKYGLFIAYYPTESVLILSKATDGWGSIFYDSTKDVARIKVKPVKLDRTVERLSYEFRDQDDSNATILLSWENLGIPFRIKTALHQLQMETIDRESQTAKVFNPAFMLDAADYMSDHNVDLEKALGYAKWSAGSMPFRSHILQSGILRKLDRTKEADEALKAAVQFGTPRQVYYYAMGKLAGKEYDLAVRALELLHSKDPNVYITNLGLAKAYLAKNDIKNASKFIKAAGKYAGNENEKKEIAALSGDVKKTG